MAQDFAAFGRKLERIEADLTDRKSLTRLGVAAKADATDLRTQEVRIQALERKESAADRDRDWMLKAQDEIKKQLTDIQRRLPPPSVP